MAHRSSCLFTNRFFLAGMLLVLAACIPLTQPPISQVSSTATPPAPEPMRVVQGHPTESYVHISWSADGRLLASGGWDNEVIIWDSKTLEPVYTLTHPDMTSASFPSFSPDGRWLMINEAWVATKQSPNASLIPPRVSKSCTGWPMGC